MVIPFFCLKGRENTTDKIEKYLSISKSITSPTPKQFPTPKPTTMNIIEMTSRLHTYDILVMMDIEKKSMFDRYYTIKQVYDIWTDAKNTEQEINYPFFLNKHTRGYTAQKFSELLMLMNNYLMAHIHKKYYDHSTNEVFDI